MFISLRNTLLQQHLGRIMAVTAAAIRALAEHPPVDSTASQELYDAAKVPLPPDDDDLGDHMVK